VIAEGNHVVVKWKREGIHHGEVAGVPANGQRVSQDGIRIWRIAGGKAVETYGAINHVATLRQLGALPPAGQSRS
jgi:predicted ester cyclase